VIWPYHPWPWLPRPVLIQDSHGCRTWTWGSRVCIRHWAHRGTIGWTWGYGALWVIAWRWEIRAQLRRAEP
jgi:hypothetical protein